ncbi:centromere protein F isoform X2 [Cygnus atratus]|uniref:centromere protein F isoform X2 n=1 Tax=Cygnus atratus TaxID=8868 RepID=UPI0021B76967|nr:centromere protein F isoform X2 [Cygnus atratus]
MSWVVEEWKEGLSPRVLQKIHELESQVDRLKKERQQRQFQLESLEVALEKQKQKVMKVENEKNEAATQKRENQSLMELCDSLDKAKQKISHDLKVKESQINIQSGQLNDSKKEIERLEQELKRYKCELERSQQALIAGDLSFSGTPQKNFTTPLTPVQSHNDAKFEELEEKYKKEVEERKKLELELRTIQNNKINQPYPQQSSLSHREIAWHQASSSVFSWQPEKTPSKNQETPAKRSSTTSYFPWEKETNSSIISEKKEFDNSFAENCNSSLITPLRAQNQELNPKVKDLEKQLQALEKEKKSHMNKHQEAELKLDRMKLELTKKDKVINKTRDKITQMTMELNQAMTQVQMMEQKMKRLSEELNCQRQNAESTRQSLEQKIKAKEKEYQEELACQQRSLQKLDQQSSHVRNKLNQELQQAKNDFNSLQAEFDKIMAVKQRLERDTSDLTQKLCRAEQALLAAQDKETDLTRSFETTEQLVTVMFQNMSDIFVKKLSLGEKKVKQEKNLLDLQFEKKVQEIHQLEEELETVKQSLKQSQNFAEEMKNKNAFQEAELKLLEEKFIKQASSPSVEQLKLALADMEKQRDSTQDLIKEKENHIKELNCKINKMEEESEALQSLLAFKQREYEELKKETNAFSQWKNENDNLLQIKGETGERLGNTEQMRESFVTETKEHVSNLQADISAHQTFVGETSAILEEKDMQLQTLNERLKNQEAELQDLKISNKLLEDSVRQLKLMSETWDSEKKGMSSMICSYKKEIEEITQENATIRDLSRALEQNQITLLEANKNISNSLKEKEEIISEMSRKHKEEKQCIDARTEEITRELKVLQEKYKVVEEENVHIMSILREQTIEFKEKKAKLEQEEKLVLSENKDILHKLIASEEIKKDLIQELQQLQSEFSDIQHVPSCELDCLRQEILNVEVRPNAMQEQQDIVFQGRKQLVKETETKNEPLVCDFSCKRRLCSEHLRKCMEEQDAELNKHQFKLQLLQMDFEDRELSLENYRLEVVQLKTALREMETELEKSVRENERLRKELLSVKKLETSYSQLTVLGEDCHSLEYNDDDVSQNCGKREMDESYSPVLLSSSLQVTINKLSELEKICERLQNENLASISGFEDSKTDGITDINKVAEEEENIMSNADTNLGAEKTTFSDEVTDPSDNRDLRMHCDNKEMSFKFKECSAGPSSDYEDLKLSSKEVKIHFAEVKEKIFSFQNEHIKLYEQHCSMISKISELQSCIEILKAENSALSTSLSNAHTDYLTGPLSSSQNGTQSKLDETKSTVSFSGLCFSEVSEVDNSFNSGMCKWIEEINQLKSCAEINSEGAANVSVENCHNGTTLDSVKEPRSITPSTSNLEGRIEELEMLCQTYEKAIKVLEDQFHIQENMKNEEIQELKNIILSERKEIDHLKQQNLSDKEEWQQKLSNLTTEMECKLAEERKQTENLFLDFKAARLQLQVLDLSSHSLVCADTENNAQQENNSLYHLGSPSWKPFPIGSPELRNNEPKLIPIEKSPVGDSCVCENVTETAEARLVEDCSEKVSGEQKCRNTSGKITSPSYHVSALSFSNSSIFLGSEDFFENQISTEALQEEAKQQTAENLKLICETEESNKNVDLQMEVKKLDSHLHFQNAQLALESSAFAELEETTVVKEENSGVKEKPESLSISNQQLSLEVLSLEKEPEKMKSELEIYQVKLSNAADTLEDVEMTKGNGREQFLGAENEQKQPKSEKVNIKKHAFLIENVTEMLQAKCQQLERDREIDLKTISVLQEHLVSVTAERNYIGQELCILSETKKELVQKYQKLQEKLKELESTKVDSSEIIRRLEDEVRTQTNLLEPAKSDINWLSSEKCNLLQKLGEDAVSSSLEEKLQNQAADANKEKELLARELEVMQSKLSASEMENSKLSRSLEGLLIEKGELAARLNSAQKEVDQMRHGIEKLKVKIESDERQKRHAAEKLKDSERKVDSLVDKIERLERELEMSGENLEDAIIQMETAKTEAETLTVEMEEMAEKLKHLQLQIDVLTSQNECLAKDVKEKQERILELESSNLTTAKLLEEKEKEKKQLKEEFENSMLLLKSELKDVSEKLEVSSEEEAVARAKEQILINQVSLLERDKTILLQECQEIKNENIKLDHTRELLVQEFMDCKQKLDEKVQENCALQQHVKETEELSSQLTHMEQECECWHQEKKALHNLVAELKLKAQHFSNNETFPDILNVLKVSYKDLEKELESTLREKTALSKKVNELTESCIELEAMLSDTEQKISKLQEEFTTEKNKLAEQIQLLQEHSEKNKTELHLTMSEKNELTKSLGMVQKELQEKESEMKREIAEYQDRLIQTEKALQDALTEANRKVNNANFIVRLRKKNELAESKVQLWMKSCKHMEKEKERLQKQLTKCEEILKKKELNMSEKEGADENAITEEIKLKLEELQESVEEKTREANENLEKYSSLIVKYYKLEQVNEMLETQVILLSGQLKQPMRDAVSSPLLNSGNLSTVSNQSDPRDEDTAELSSKRQRYEDTWKDNGEPRSPMPESSSKEKRKDSICQNLLCQENSDCELDGLPEVVKKGFADIPIGKVTPYILRRTTLNLGTNPRLGSPSEKFLLPTQDVQKGSDNLGKR